MEKDRKIPKQPMNPAQQMEGKVVGSLFVEAKPVWFLRNGEVNPVWLSICKEEGNQTKRLLKEVASFKNLSQSWQQVKRNKGISGVDGQTIEEFSENWKQLSTEPIVILLYFLIFFPNTTLKSLRVAKAIPTFFALFLKKISSKFIVRFLLPQYLEQGFYSLTENYKRHFVNYILKKPPYT